MVQELLGIVMVGGWRGGEDQDGEVVRVVR